MLIIIHRRGEEGLPERAEMRGDFWTEAEIWCGHGDAAACAQRSTACPRNQSRMPVNHWFPHLSCFLTKMGELAMELSSTGSVEFGMPYFAAFVHIV